MFWRARGHRGSLACFDAHGLQDLSRHLGVTRACNPSQVLAGYTGCIMVAFEGVASMDKTSEISMDYCSDRRVSFGLGVCIPRVRRRIALAASDDWRRMDMGLSTAPNAGGIQ